MYLTYLKERLFSNIIPVLFFTIIILISLITTSHSKRREYITIGTGGISGIYYPTGSAICQFVNNLYHGMHCTVESTGGSIHNINSLKKNVLDHGGGMDIAIIQSDWLYNAYNGKARKEFIKDPFTDLRFILSLHTEAFTIAVRGDSNIETLDDILGKRVNIGPRGSGNRATMGILMKDKGWTKEDFLLVSELKASEQPQALCDNKIDVMIYSVGHPNGAIKEALSSCMVKIIPIPASEIDELIKKHPYYIATKIPGGMYRGVPNDIPTFGLKATLVTTTETKEKTIYKIAQSIYETLPSQSDSGENNFSESATVPVFQSLRKEGLIEGSAGVPFHKGALSYFKEVGLK